MPLIKTVYPSCGGTVRVYNDHVPTTEAERAERKAIIEAACLRAVQEAVALIGKEAVMQKIMDGKAEREKWA